MANSRHATVGHFFNKNRYLYLHFITAPTKVYCGCCRFR